MFVSRYVFQVASGVMCLDIHPEHQFLLAAGMYDGSVAIYDLREGTNNPLYRATAKSGKHTDPVWQVRERTPAVHCSVLSGQVPRYAGRAMT